MFLSVSKNGIVESINYFLSSKKGMALAVIPIFFVL